MTQPHIFDSPLDLLGQEGKRFGPTPWLPVEQDRIDGFADATGDHQWIHVDRERAKTGPFGSTIAHGFLTLSLVAHFLPQLVDIRHTAHGVNVGADRLRFITPVPSGSRVRAVGELMKVEEIKGGIQTTMRVTVELEGSEKPACVVDMITRAYPE